MPEVAIQDDDGFELRKRRHCEKPGERRKRNMTAVRRKSRRTHPA